MTHHEEWLQKHPSCQKVIQKITSFIKNDLKFDPISQSEIINAFGIWKTNSMGLKNGQGLYPIGSILSHSCVANLEPLTDLGECLVLRSKVHISKGEELSIHYELYWNHRQTLRQKLKQQWFFDCTCCRCRDPTDMGTMFSSEKCSKCFLGFMLESGEPSKYICSSCNREQNEPPWTEEYQVENINEALVTLENLNSRFHANHFINLNLKYKFIRLLMKETLQSVDKELLNKGVAFYREILTMMDKLDPGVTNDKGMLMIEMTKVQMELLQRLKKENKIVKEEFMKEVKDIAVLQHRGKKMLSIKMSNFKTS